MKGYKYVKPAPGLRVVDPLQFTALPEKGMWVAWTGRAGKYWRRRMMVGDIVESTPPKTEVKEVKKEIKNLNKKDGK